MNREICPAGGYDAYQTILNFIYWAGNEICSTMSETELFLLEFIDPWYIAEKCNAMSNVGSGHRL